MAEDEKLYQIVIFEQSDGRQIPRASANVSHDTANAIRVLLERDMIYDEFNGVK